jgi:hypothetical protein
MGMRSVKQALEAFAEEHGIPVAELVRAQVNDHLEGSLSREDPAVVPPRYCRLVAEVFLRLPEGWDSHAHWMLVAANIESGVDVLLAGARLLEAESGDLQLWEVQLDPTRLERFSDAAVRWVIAHELAHVASGLPTDKHRRDDVLGEDRADHFATLWGFQEERDAFETENAALN